MGYEAGEGGDFQTALKRLFSLRGRTPFSIGSEITPVVVVGETNHVPFSKAQRWGTVTRIQPAVGAQFSFVWIQPTDKTRLIIVDWIFVNQNVANKYFVNLANDPTLSLGAGAPTRAVDNNLYISPPNLDLTATIHNATNASSAAGGTKNIISAISFASVAQPIFYGPWVLGFNKLFGIDTPVGLVVHGEPVNTDLYVTFGIRDVPLVT